MQWFRQAKADAREARTSHSPLHALFWVQQSVEKSVKGYMLLNGKTYQNAGSIRHQSLKGDLRLVRDVLEIPLLGKFIEEFVDPEAKKKLGTIQ